MNPDTNQMNSTSSNFDERQTASNSSEEEKESPDEDEQAEQEALDFLSKVVAGKNIVAKCDGPNKRCPGNLANNRDTDCYCALHYLKCEAVIKGNGNEKDRCICGCTCTELECERPDENIGKSFEDLLDSFAKKLKGASKDVQNVLLKDRKFGMHR